MIFTPALQPAKLLKRYKRFLADVELPDGEIVTIHCPNTGSMLNCQMPGSRIWYSESDNPKRKYSRTWEFIENENGCLIGINSARANALTAEALEAKRVTGLTSYERLRREIPYGEEGSRIDILLEFGPATEPEQRSCYLEVKNVSLGVGGGIAEFPDAVSLRGQKHLRELIKVRQQGHRAMLFYCVQHTGITLLRPADSIDPDYGKLLREAVAAGVEVRAMRTDIELGETSRIELSVEIDVDLGPSSATL